MEVAAFGRPCVVDPGTFCYGTDPARRDHFRGTAAHSTVTIDGLGQAKPGHLFEWRDRPVAALRRFETSAAFDFADAEHDAYLKLPDPVLHRRRVLFVKPRYWVIVDDLVGQAEHLIEHRLQFADLPVSVDGDWTRAEGLAGHGLLARVFTAGPLERQLEEAGALARLRPPPAGAAPGPLRPAAAAAPPRHAAPAARGRLGAGAERLGGRGGARLRGERRADRDRRRPRAGPLTCAASPGS